MALDPGAQWAINLTEGGYENHCRSEDELRKIKKLGFAWRRILTATGVRPPAEVFEIGCGGGEQLATLALNGFSATGIDVSPDVLARARRYLAEIEAVAATPLRAKLIDGDFFSFTTPRRYRLVYHFGVVEHYLDPADRARFWGKAVELTAPGGWVVSVVPCGRHLMRPRMRAEELCGYQHRLAETDYSAAIHRAEFERAGLGDIQVLPHGYFFFLSGHPSPAVRRIGFPLLFGAGNAVLPWFPVPAAFKERFAHTLIVAGRKAA
jgi:SAM-dependent methyltransferase